MNRYLRWRREGYLCSTGRCFDIGATVSAALRRYRRTGNPLAGIADPSAAGNGCIMRLAPVPIFFFPDEAAAIEHAEASCRATHGAVECIEATKLFAAILVRALAGVPREDLLAKVPGSFQSERIAAIANGSYVGKPESDVQGSGYVVESLEAALWSFAETESFEAAILRAANLGDDADTTAAVCGQVAGAFYGEPAIPPRWLERLTMADDIRGLCDRLRSRAQA